MKRGQPPKRTAIKRSPKQIKARSSKTTVRDDARRDLSKQWLDEAAQKSRLGIPECEIRWDRKCEGQATHAHEPKLRSRGGDILTRAECLLTCWPCHQSVHLAYGADLDRAYEMGFLKHSWEP